MSKPSRASRLRGTIRNATYALINLDYSLGRLAAALEALAAQHEPKESSK